MARDLLNWIEKKFWIKTEYKTDDELFDSLKKWWLPSLAYLLEHTKD